MKEIFDKLREDVKIPEIVNKKAEDAFEKIYAECKDNTKEAEIKNIKPTKRHNLKKMTVVVAAAVMLCAVTTAPKPVGRNAGIGRSNEKCRKQRNE